MDAFSVSIVNAVAEPGMGRLRRSAIAGTYALFQFAMPLAGWLCVHTIATIFTSFQKFIPWIALVLLLCIGGKMIITRHTMQQRQEVSKWKNVKRN